MGAGALAVPALLAGCSSPAKTSGGGSSGKAGSSGLDAVLAQAKKEGAAVWFLGSGQYTPDQLKQLEDGFEAEFGFPMKITLASGGSVSQQMAKLGEEATAGIPPTYDVVNGGTNTMKPLFDAGASVKWDWAGMGIPADALVNVPGQGDLLDLFENPRTPFYNTEKIAEADIPKTWDDLLDPQWTGKIVTGSTPSIWGTISESPSLGEQKTAELLTKLVQDQKIAMVPTITDISAVVATGEYDIGIATGIEQDVAKGAPLKYLQLDSKNVPIQNLIVCLKNAPHPNAGAALMYFFSATDRGKKLLYDVVGYARRDYAGSSINELYGGDRGLIVSSEVQMNEIPKRETEFQKILKGAVAVKG